MLAPLIILGTLGLLFGFGLYIASCVFHIKMDPRIERIEAALPGANCGACGLAGCSGFAKAIVHGSVDIVGCIPGGEEVTKILSGIMGVEAKTTEKEVAILYCAGRAVENSFRYTGIKTCRSATQFQGGPKACTYGCIGFGDCERACLFDAIKMLDGLPMVNEEKCVSCGKCVDACPKDLFSLRSLKKLVHISCKSNDTAKITRLICKVGCIACKKCENICPFDAVHVKNNLAEIDYEKCTSCGKCVEECPTNTIINVREDRKAKGLWPVKKT